MWGGPPPQACFHTCKEGAELHETHNIRPTGPRARPPLGACRGGACRLQCRWTSTVKPYSSVEDRWTPVELSRLSSHHGGSITQIFWGSSSKRHETTQTTLKPQHQPSRDQGTRGSSAVLYTACSYLRPPGHEYGTSGVHASHVDHIAIRTAAERMESPNP